MTKKKLKKLVQEIEDSANEEPQKEKELDMTKVVSTGSTLLDLAISGTVVRGGGVPGGIIVEISGPSGSGKSALLAELAGNAQSKGGDVRFDDPEARFNSEYSRIYGVALQAKNYNRPDTVKEMFNGLWAWKPEPEVEGSICVSCEDSLAALSTEMEMEEADTMGMKRAKDFSEGLRKTCRMIADNNWLIACSNQEREGTRGPTTPGGKAIPYYSSLRIRMAPSFPSSKIIKNKTIGGKKLSRVIGVYSTCVVKKSSIDKPYREAPVYIVFNYGIDDIRANLQWHKDVTGSKKYFCIDEEFSTMEKAITFIEEKGLENPLKELVIDTWEDIEKLFIVERNTKKR